MKKKSIAAEKSFDFALNIIDVYMRLKQDNEFVLSKQLVRSGTSIGANIEEALAGYSEKDFANKMSISNKEARETNYWLRLIDASPHFNLDVKNLLDDSEELIRILTAIVKTTQTKNR